MLITGSSAKAYSRWTILRPRQEVNYERAVNAWQSRRMSTALEGLLQRHVDGGTVPGAVAMLGSGGAVETVAVGVAEVDGEAMREDAIMRIQSMTKPITSVAALRLVEAGRLGLDDSLEEWLPEIADRRVLPTPTRRSTTPCPPPGPSPFAIC